MASQNVVIIINGPGSASITYTPALESFTAPVAAGIKMGSFAVLPAEWSGTMALSGADAAKFRLDQIAGTTFLATAVELGAGTYNVAVTATP